MSKNQEIPSEHAEQAAVVRWFDAVACGRIYAVPNGGTRSQAYTAHLHAEGMRTGAPDLIAALPGGRTVWIEMKRARKSKSRVSPAQRAEHACLQALGHEVHVCYGAAEAIAVLTAALEEVRPSVAQMQAVEAAVKGAEDDGKA